MVIGGRRLPRWALAAAAALLALAAAATWGPGLLNLERYRGQIVRQVGRAIGREVSVGAITASFWRLGAEARGIRVAERAGYGQAPFLEADALRIRVELLPLFRGQLRVATAVLERPRIHLVRDRQGNWNVEDLWPAIGPGGAAAPAGRTAPEPSRAPRQAVAGALLLRDLRARGGEVRIDDLQAPPASAASLAIHNLRLDLGQGESPEAVTIGIAGEVGGGALAAAATLTPRGSALAVDARATLKGFDLSALEASLGNVGASGPADLAITAKGQLPGLDVTGEVDLARARLDVGPLARKAPGEEAHLSFSGRIVGEGVDLPKVRVQWRGAVVEGRMVAARLRPLELTFAADAALLDLDRLLAPAGGPQGEARKAAGAPAGFFGAAPAWASPPPGRAGIAGAREAPATAGPPIVADGVIRAEAMRWHGLEARDVRATLAYRDAVLGIREATGRLAGGSLAASGTIDLRGRYPALTATGRMEEAQVQPLVAAFLRGQKLEAQGVLTAEGQIALHALAPGNALGALVGSGSLVVRDGRVVGYKPLERLGDMLAAATGGGSPRARLDEFQRLSATFTLDKGFLRTPDLTLVRPDGQAKMAGSLNLLDTSLDFDVAVRLGKVTVEAKVMGTAADPLVVPTVARLEKRFEMEFDRALKGERGKKMRDLLKNLLQ